MRDVVAGEWEQIRELLLQPSAENVSRAAALLESLAEKVARARFSVSSDGLSDESSGESGAETSRFLATVRGEAIRARHLLDNAARLYNALNATVDAAGYERHGFVCPVEVPRRALARL